MKITRDFRPLATRYSFDTGPCSYPGWPHLDRSPDSKSFTADFMRLQDGRFLYLEGGPPFGSGAHPCCFEHFDNWGDGTAFHLSGVPVALKGAAS